MRVLIGTTNPSKKALFEALLAGSGAACCSLTELGVTAEAPETGADPAANAAQKARFYARFHDPVVCNDAGLYLLGLPLDDPRQPGLRIRTPSGGKRLDDGEMISWYARLVRGLGGRTLAAYRDGIAVCRDGKLSVWLMGEEAMRERAFVLVDRPSAARRPGWPLDSLSLARETGRYFSEGERPGEAAGPEGAWDACRLEQRRFLLDALGLETENG